MQDGHQVHHGVLAGDRARQRRLIVHVQLQHSQRWQGQQMAGMDLVPGGHGHMPVLTHQFFAHMGTDKAGAAHNQNVFHALNLALCTSLLVAQRQKTELTRLRAKKQGRQSR